MKVLASYYAILAYFKTAKNILRNYYCTVR